MIVRCPCSKCGASMVVHDYNVGQQVKCPTCHLEQVAVCPAEQYACPPTGCEQGWRNQLSSDLACPKCGKTVKRTTGHITDQRWLPSVGGAVGAVIGFAGSSMSKTNNPLDATAGSAIIGAKAGFAGAIIGIVFGFVIAAVFCPAYNCISCGKLALREFPDAIRKRELLLRYAAPALLIVIILALIAVKTYMEFGAFWR
ncbi:MAG: hypothetical protein PCFJNLEI_02031 [Verrucomicrobiae bacterium]|nr:hypothetical protein [Verrucomicrobiae bacterium]